MDISLALGGGGIRGVAHIGVLRSLEKHGFKVKAIAGTSAGGLVGAVYAAGYSTEEIESVVNNLGTNWVFSRNNSDRPAILGIGAIAKKLSGVLGEKTFEELKIPYAATAVSLRTGKEFILRKGKVLDAALATMAIPGVFPSQEIGGSVLVDGGVLDPVPIRLARWMQPDLPVVAVVLHKKPEGYGADETAFPISIPVPTPITDRIAKFRMVQAMQIFAQSMEVTSTRLTDMGVKLYKPEVLIEPRVGHIGMLQNVDTKDLIQAGMDATEEVLNELQSETSWMKQIERAVKQRLNPEPLPDIWENENKTA
ncbi:MAG: patatin-like phospholipase family protein [Anaerolineaceae bacterium]|nr:patatin-like phospholipase family protein [Anaerolineaceae bacterium]